MERVEGSQEVQQPSMKMSLFEKSECFRAFLLLIGVDRRVTSEERHLLLTIGRKLDFDAHFCETAIDDLLENRYIGNEPPLFSRREFAESFLRDGLVIAYTDRYLHPAELDWLARIAQRNGLSVEWMSAEIATLQKRGAPIAHDATLMIEMHM